MRVRGGEEARQELQGVGVVGFTLVKDVALVKSGFFYMEIIEFGPAVRESNSRGVSAAFTKPSGH